VETDTLRPFCEAAAEWEHDWTSEEAGPQVCRECGTAAGPPMPAEPREEPATMTDTSPARDHAEAESLHRDDLARETGGNR
jgi:hypothetical protein